MTTGDDWADIFSQNNRIPEIILPVPYVNNLRTYGQGDMVVFIGREGGGRLGATYRASRWLGEVRHYPDGLTGAASQILHAASIYVGGWAGHFDAAREYVEEILGDLDLKDAGWPVRLREWAHAYLVDRDEE